MHLLLTLLRAIRGARWPIKKNLEFWMFLFYFLVFFSSLAGGLPVNGSAVLTPQRYRPVAEKRLLQRLVSAAAASIAQCPRIMTRAEKSILVNFARF